MAYKIIGESGGTKTDWVVYHHNQLFNQFTTNSYHPNLIDENWISIAKAFWSKFESIAQYDLIFYGAGCLSLENKTKMTNLFKSFGFGHVEVQSDLIAAAMATGNYPDGIVGIMGTGSVIAKIKDGQVATLIGGKGFKTGDEGSGYYFGKLLLQKYLNGQLSVALSHKMSKLIEEVQLNTALLFEQEGKAFLSGLSFQTKDWNDEQIVDVHKANIQLFATLFLKPEMISKIDLVGSYAYYHQKLISEVLKDLDIQLGVVIERPIEKLPLNQ